MEVQWIPGEQMFANAYVSGSVLVDAGALPMVVEPYRDRIETILLTHCHFDHIAHAAEIAHMCHAEIVIHRNDAPGLTDERRNLSLLFGARLPAIVPDRTLSDGDRIGDLEVIHTPGHTPGSVCLYDRDHAVLFSGDTVFAGGGFGRCDFPYGSMQALRTSLERLGTLRVEELYPGHGEPVTAGAGRHIEAALRFIGTTYG
ncbi:MAG: MBL fold metallo-hydrolase [Methanomicrobiaceae archaeon]|nr:MBL fold metallo-hydrolase [Methanomicrobiaceae archaeon]